MSLLRSVESTIANLVEGAFGRVFRSEVRPMELARKLAREMDANRTVSVSRTYAPNEFDVWLSPRDRERYEGVEGEVIEELVGYLLEHARREDLILASPPHIAFHTDERLSLGEFGISAHSARPPEQERPEEDEGSHTMIYSAAARTREPLAQASGRAPRALLLVNGRRMLVPPSGGTIGRSRDCEIVIDDSGVSRRHARITPTGLGWSIEDLGSTNGIGVNGRPVRGPQELAPGDRIDLGSTEIVFETG